LPYPRLMKKLNFLTSLFFLIFAALSSWAGTLETRLKGVWNLKELSCAGKKQELPMKYTLSFDGLKGEYVSTTKTCVQKEAEAYTYVSENKVAIKQGLRTCEPNPCDADLPKSECGKETNPKLPVFDIAFKNNFRTLILSTSDPNSIDCAAAGQSKPAVFVFTR
jgi:hypothetical protein